MNCSTTCNTASFISHGRNAEQVSAMHESAKQRAQTLRREAISMFIDDAITWAKTLATPARRVSTANAKRTKRSVNLA
jgi:hypothetical protein